MKKSELKQIIKEEISKILNESKYEIIDPQQSKQSLDNILDAIKLLNNNGLKLTPEDKSGHYSGGYNHINSMYVNSPVPFDVLIRKANNVLAQNDMEHLKIIEVQSNIELIGPDIDELLDAINFINTGVKTNKGLQPHSFGKNTLKALDSDGHSIGSGKFSIGVKPKTSNESQYIGQVNDLLDDHGFKCKLYMTK